jgi:hypothetical protein
LKYPKSGARHGLNGTNITTNLAPKSNFHNQRNSVPRKGPMAMPDTNKEIIRNSTRAAACVIPFLFCLAAGLTALSLDVPMRPTPVGVVLITGAAGWAWLFLISIREIDYLQKLKSARHY